MVRIGVLALQGDFAAHAASLSELGIEAEEVRRPQELAGLAGLVIPGGESTTLLNLMQDEPWFEELRLFHERGGALLGTCAGAILLAREVLNPEQPGLGLIDVVVERNAYGRQVDSFEAELSLPGTAEPMKASFIRAPRFLEMGSGVETLATLNGDAVLIRQDRVLAGTFHSELGSDHRVHEMFLKMATNNQSTESESGRVKCWSI
jgi:5'-phosphate synthase pdxT subunit